MFIVACFLNLKSDGAKQLVSYCNASRVLMLELDIRSSESISKANRSVAQLLEQNRELSNFKFKNFW